MQPTDDRTRGVQPSAAAPDSSQPTPEPDTNSVNLADVEVHRPEGSAADDPAFRHAYPHGTYGYGPESRIDKPAQPHPEGAGASPLSELIDFERPDTPVSRAERGESLTHEERDGSKR
jgi:hypothetical protein